MTIADAIRPDKAATVAWYVAEAAEAALQLAAVDLHAAAQALLAILPSDLDRHVTVAAERLAARAVAFDLARSC